MEKDAENPMIIDDLWRDLDAIDAEEEEREEAWHALADMAYDTRMDFEEAKHG